MHTHIQKAKNSFFDIEADFVLQYSTISRKQGLFTVKRDEGTGETVLFFKDTSSYGTSIDNTPCVRNKETKISPDSTITMGDITLLAKRIPLVFMIHSKKDIASAEKRAWIEKVAVPTVIGGQMEHKDVFKATHMIADTLNSKQITKRLLTALLKGIPIVNTKWIVTLTKRLSLGPPDVADPEYAPAIESGDSSSGYAGLTQESLRVNDERKRLFENVDIVFFEQKQFDMFHEIMSCGGGNPVLWEHDVFFPQVTPGCTVVAMKPTDEESEKLRMTIFRKRNYEIIDDEILVKSIVFVRPIKDIVKEIQKEKNVPWRREEEEDNGIDDGACEKGRVPSQNGDDHDQTQEAQPPAKFPRLYEGAGTSAPPPKRPESELLQIDDDDEDARRGIKVQYAYLVRENRSDGNGGTNPKLYTTKTFKKAGTVQQQQQHQQHHHQQQQQSGMPQNQLMKPIKFVRCVVGKDNF